MFPYRKLPLISPGLTNLPKGFYERGLFPRGAQFVYEMMAPPRPPYNWGEGACTWGGGEAYRREFTLF